MTYTSTVSLATERSAFAANTYRAGKQTYRDLAPLAGGGFVLGYDTLLDFYDAGFGTAGNRVVAAGTILSIAARANGGAAVLVRTGDGNDLVQIFDARAHQIGATIDVSDLDNDTSLNTSQIVSLADGGFFILYDLSQGNGRDTYLDRYSASGLLVDSRQISTAARGSFPTTTILADGGIAIVYSTGVPDGGTDLHATVLNADGTVRSADRIVAGLGSDADFRDPHVAATANGGYALLYHYLNPSAIGDSVDEVVLRTYDSTGAEIGTAQVLAHYDGDSGTYYNLQITALENGLVAVSWAENSGDHRYDTNLTILNEDARPSDFYPMNVVVAQTDFFHMPDLHALLRGELFLSGPDAAIDGSGAGVSVKVLNLVRTSIGTADADPFFGDALDDKVYAGGGADLVAGAGGVDTLDGEAGEDFIRGGLDHDYLYGGTENDQVQGDEGDDFISGDDGDDTVSGDAGDDIVLGGAGVDAVSGGDANDTLYGEAGNDTLDGGAGRDRLDGGSGVDTLRGGAGNDVYVLAGLASAGGFPMRYVTDTVVEAANSGSDLVLVQTGTGKFDIRGYTLTANVEDATLTGSAAGKLVGNTLANHLIGNAAANDLTGGAGRDALSGGAGNDRFVFADVATGTPGGWGKDEITDFVRGQDLIDFTGAGQVRGFGSLTITDVFGDARIATGRGDTILLDGVAAASLTAADFVFRPAQTAPEPATHWSAPAEFHDWTYVALV